VSPPAPAATPAPEKGAEKPPEAHPEKKWYEKISLRGYMQLRYNRFGLTNRKLVNEAGDKSVGVLNSFYLRRIRLVFSGDIGDHVSLYFQPDFAGAISDSLNVGMVRDAYADVSFDSKKEFRVRIGQSKVPFGFENIQSSQNRLTMDRSDALNSAVPGERDLGLFFYWAPQQIRARFKYLVESGLKGSGDYGVFAFGVYNGQGINLKERNDHVHMVARLTWPFQIGKQIVEVGGGGYAGRVNVKVAKPIENSPSEFDDRRGHVAFILYPQPFGLQAEYNFGTGPTLENGVIKQAPLQGGYVLASFKAGSFIPFARFAYYDGGKKADTNAPHYLVRELEAGLEWQAMKALELTGSWYMADRTSPDAPYAQVRGGTLRLQAQVNY
jgi:hypothetical protein